jgi:predicted transcriptional regulator
MSSTLQKQTKELREIDTSTWQRMPCMVRRRTDLTSNDKLVYMYMLSQFRHFSRIQKDYHENMEDIALEIGIGRRTVGDSVKRLSELGLIQVFKKSVYGTKLSVISYSYAVKDAYDVFSKSKTIDLKPELKKVTKFYDDDDEDIF